MPSASVTAISPAPVRLATRLSMRVRTALPRLPMPLAAVAIRLLALTLSAAEPCTPMEPAVAVRRTSPSSVANSSIRMLRPAL
ncbi:hypothetical protein D9M71_435880 [compost metagenome]